MRRASPREAHYVRSLEELATIHSNGPVAAEKVNLVQRPYLRVRCGLRSRMDDRKKRAMLYQVSAFLIRVPLAILTEEIQKEEYERASMAEIETRKKLAERVEFLTSERARLRGERGARERQLQMEQEERERPYREEQGLLKQELAELRLELQQKDHKRVYEENGVSLPTHDGDAQLALVKPE